MVGCHRGGKALSDTSIGDRFYRTKIFTFCYNFSMLFACEPFYFFEIQSFQIASIALPCMCGHDWRTEVNIYICLNGWFFPFETNLSSLKLFVIEKLVHIYHLKAKDRFLGSLIFTMGFGWDSYTADKDSVLWSDF